ncbi:hypothetical protein FHL15_003200 [Xylaria flabelliformis]|uniref:Uncharacterized protein n=1 Tax=Xylaria flabelliformis TaxID=2512241 RepID=A0A553I781_9PEZI|nr:hypothetical protein FHL15_003200 [Xylaria flabelliformis]
MDWLKAQCDEHLAEARDLLSRYEGAASYLLKELETTEIHAQQPPVTCVRAKMDTPLRWASAACRWKRRVALNVARRSDITRLLKVERYRLKVP